MSTKVNRDRREIMLNIAANADMKSYPYQVSGNITQLDYALSAVNDILPLIMLNFGHTCQRISSCNVSL